MLNRPRTLVLLLVLGMGLGLGSSAFAALGGPAQSVPEPGSFALVALGLVAAVWAGRARRRRQRKQDR